MNFAVPRFLKQIHWPLVILTVLFAVLGIFEIYSASFREGGSYASKQLCWLFVGLLVFFATMWLGYRSFLDLGYLFYGLTIGMLVWVLFFGESVSGAQRWIFLGPFALQPSEFAKVATLLTLANFLAARSPVEKQKRTFLMASVLVGLPTLLVLKQPDLGSALVFLPLFLAMMFLWGIRFRYLILLFLMGLSSLPLLWHILKPYQQKRILVFFNPQIDPIGASYTAIQSKIAVGSGGLFGKGWLGGTQTQLDFVPEHHTDFIFSVVAEEFGFLGAFFLVILFLLLISYIFQIMQQTTDFRARLLAVGIASAIAFQVFVNIGMTIGLAPITGIPLPFISYGGSSLIANFFILGLLASVYKERSIF
ncbi:MAG: rod shape-determining protein RodA [Candidatus Omnitrophica bacterium]|nr:rod shape-determining protein RodA [Candidatus Omnitrophota bacterium]